MSYRFGSKLRQQFSFLPERSIFMSRSPYPPLAIFGDCDCHRKRWWVPHFSPLLNDMQWYARNVLVGRRERIAGTWKRRRSWGFQDLDLNNTTAGWWGESWFGLVACVECWVEKESNFCSQQSSERILSSPSFGGRNKTKPREQQERSDNLYDFCYCQRKIRKIVLGFSYVEGRCPDKTEELKAIRK